jgi:hypothetical protein
MLLGRFRVPIDGRSAGEARDRASAATLVDNERMPTVPSIEAQMKAFGIRTVGKGDIARRLADALAEDEQVIALLRASVVKRDGKSITSGDDFLLLTLTERRLVLGVRARRIKGTIGNHSFTGMPFHVLSDLTDLGGGRFEWTFEGQRWMFLPPHDLVRVGANEAKANRFYELLKNRVI